MDAQRQVAEFVERHDIDAPPEFRLLDAVSELGELAKDATTSTGYGDDPDALELSTDEFGDALFALLALADSVDVDADDALETALAKYEERLAETGDAGSGE